MAKKKQQQRNNKKKKNRNRNQAAATSQSTADAEESSARDDILAEYMTNSENAFKQFQSLTARGEEDGDLSAEDMKKVCVYYLDLGADCLFFVVFT